MLTHARAHNSPAALSVNVLNAADRVKRRGLV